MTKYTLQYFGLRGRAEGARWLFAHAGTEYEDVRIDYVNEWPAKKPDLNEYPFQQLPVLKVTGDDGKSTVIAQSYAIVRYLAATFGFAGKTDLDVARADMICEHITSALQFFPWGEKDKEKKLQLTKEAVQGPIKEHFKLLERLVQDNGYLVGDSLTVADISFGCACDWLIPPCPDTLDDTPKLKSLNERVRSSPGIAAWIAKRPVTDM